MVVVELVKPTGASAGLRTTWLASRRPRRKPGGWLCQKKIEEKGVRVMRAGGGVDVVIQIRGGVVEVKYPTCQGSPFPLPI